MFEPVLVTVIWLALVMGPVLVEGPALVVVRMLVFPDVDLRQVLIAESCWRWTFQWWLSYSSMTAWPPKGKHQLAVSASLRLDLGQVPQSWQHTMAASPRWAWPAV